MEVVMLSLVLVSIVATRVTPMSIDKVLLTSATRPDVFDSFHVMPDGEIKVLQELDMMLSVDQFKQLYQTDKQGRSKRKASIIADHWTDFKVFYEILQKGMSKSDRSNIMEAIDEWQKYTCLDFLESSNATRRIQFKKGPMCSSEVGMMKRIQEITLTSGCLESKGNILHEIGHAIGWFHEHMRHDRDRYIIVTHGQGDAFFKKDYEKYPFTQINTYDIQYDYRSIMHYGNGSIITINANYQDQIGQRIGLSFKDIKLANAMYNCAARCSSDPINCGHGFQLSRSFRNRTCQCWCDSGNLSDPLMQCGGQEVPNFKTLYSHADPEIECVDTHDVNKCDTSKKEGSCTLRPTLMNKFCPKTCGFCGMQQQISDICMDHEPGCAVMAMAGLDKEPGFKDRMNQTCKVSSGLCKQPDPCEIQKLMDHKETMEP